MPGKTAGNGKKKINELDRNIPISAQVFEEIERYLRMQMAADEQKSFEEKLIANATLQDRVKQVQLMLTGIQEISLRASLPHFHAELPAVNGTVATISRTVILKRWLVAASIILVLAVSSWLLFGKKSQDEKIYAAYFQPDPGLISAMGITDNYVFDKAMIDYKTGNYTAAIAAWEGQQKNNPRNDTLNYFIGAAYLANKDSKQAIPYLQMVIKSGKSFLVKDANWYAGLAMIKEHHLKEAVPLIERSEHPQKQALLQQLQQASK